MKKLVIGTRGSKLALWQASWVRDRLASLHPEVGFEIAVVKTAGDARHDLPPDAFGQEGIFTAELDRRLNDGSIDLAVHSLKDLPTRLGPGLCLAAVTERAEVADRFILRSDRARALGITGRQIPIAALETAGPGITVGTSSLRRMVQLQSRFPRLGFAPMRGNLDTRLGKLAAGRVDALVVAEAGLIRLGIDTGEHPVLRLDPGWYLPAAGQGALGIESRDKGEARDLAASLDHRPTALAVTAERVAMAALGAGCRVPAGFFAQILGARLVLKGVVGSPAGGPLLCAEVEGAPEDPHSAGRSLVDALLAKGADQVLEEVRGAR